MALAKNQTGLAHIQIIVVGVVVILLVVLAGFKVARSKDNKNTETNATTETSAQATIKNGAKNKKDLNALSSSLKDAKSSSENTSDINELQNLSQ